MADKKSLKDAHSDHREENWTPVHWRAWGSWFSWGSPVGLGLFFISCAVTFWVVMQAI